MRLSAGLPRAARALGVLFVTVAVLVLAGCPASDAGRATTEPPAIVPIVRIGLTPAVVALDVGATQTLSAVVYDASGASRAGRTVRFATSNAAVATVDEHGAVAAVSPGSAAITATSVDAPTVSARAEVAVRAADVTLTVARSGSGAGTVASAPDGIQCPTTCAAPFASGTVVTLTATAAAGSTFAGWTGACTAATTICTATTSAAQTATARFEPLYALRVAFAGTGTGRVKSAEAALDCAVACTASVVSGTVATLVAEPDAGSTFGGWSGACSGASLTCTTTVDQARDVTATFSAVIPTYALGISVAGTGTVSSVPAGIACPSTCSGTFESGTVVTLTATPGAGQVFAGWSGACTGAVTCGVRMGGVREVTATFAPVPAARFPLGVTVGGAGAGSVVSSPAGISCPGTCGATFDAGSVVTLTAIAGAATVFGGWTGACTTLAATCTVPMTAARDVGAIFGVVASTVPLTVALAGGGSGTVTSAPGGIDCPATCTTSTALGATVTLVATAGVGSSFAGWSGACTGAGTTCTVTMTAARSVVATFAPAGAASVALSVSISGQGSVSSTPTGLACTVGTCSTAFPLGTVVTLTAVAATGYTFSGWSGNCTSSAATCTTTMDRAKAVEAAFAPVTPTRTLNVSIQGAGRVRSDPAGLDCTASCIAPVASSQPILLTATPAPGYAFVGWYLDCRPVGLGPCTTSSTFAQIGAKFVPVPPPRTPTFQSAAGTWVGTARVNGADFMLTFTLYDGARTEGQIRAANGDPVLLVYQEVAGAGQFTRAALSEGVAADGLYEPFPAYDGRISRGALGVDFRSWAGVFTLRCDILPADLRSCTGELLLGPFGDRYPIALRRQ